ncbi:MAG: hypothetical protein JWN41_920, partial [Thermoleophilia bacterium]|nr:hypothetical protein [Thermoleophilia bacterium]
MGAHQLQKGADYFASRAAERRGAWKSLLIGIGVLAAFIAAQIVATAALTAVGVELSVTRLDLPRAIATIAFELITLACAWPLVRPLGGRRAAAVGDPRARMRPGLWMVAPITLLVVGAPALLAALGDDRLIAKHLGLGEAVALVALAVIISVTEELWFRGLLIAGLGGEQRPWLSIMA